MLPYVLIGLISIGLMYWLGVWGLVIGPLCGYVVVLLLGHLSGIVQGGLLPRKVRREAASRFIALHSGLVQKAFPNWSEGDLQSAVENSIENVSKRAAAYNRAVNVKAAWTHPAILAAGAALAEEEPDPEKKAFLVALTQFMAI